jgi:hypothetical protein
MAQKPRKNCKKLENINHAADRQRRSSQFAKAAKVLAMVLIY